MKRSVALLVKGSLAYALAYLPLPDTDHPVAA